MSIIPEKTIKQKAAETADVCKIKKCNKIGKWDKRSNKYYLTRELCTGHYHKLVRYGDPEWAKDGREEHGMYKTPEYAAWQSIKGRCLNKNNLRYSEYGGRGIKICKSWERSFNAFYNDMGDKPTAQHSIDRIDVNKGYKPSNCRWATIEEQANNRQDSIYIEHDGQKMTLSQWADALEMPRSTLRRRIKSGWSHRKALTTPIKKSKNIHIWK